MTALSIDTGDPTPPYEQLRRQIVELVDTGRLRAGDRLPSVRQLAGDLGVATGTVARSYRELESAGLLVTRRGGGTRVSEAARPARPSTLLAEYAAGYVARAGALGVPDEAVLEAVRAALAGVSAPPGPAR